MQVEIRIDSSCSEPRIVVFTDKMSDEINNLVKKLSGDFPQLLTGIKNGALEVLEEAGIYRIYAMSGKVFAAAEGGEYLMRQRLYELEERLDGTMFVRISNSEIINLKKVRKLDLSLTGTIRVLMTDGAATYVSRRYVKKIKQVLGI